MTKPKGVPDDVRALALAQGARDPEVLNLLHLADLEMVSNDEEDLETRLRAGQDLARAREVDRLSTKARAILR